VTKIKSAWESHPGYRIDLVPIVGTARVSHAGLVLAESTSAIRVIETDHVERLYIPEADVRLDLLSANENHTVCPFKGEADYWSLTASDPIVEDVFWTYRTPFEEVAGISGHLGVYHEKVDVEIETRWDDDERAVSADRFPAWGDERDLLGLLDAQPVGDGRFSAPGYHVRARNVVEAGQMLGQAIVAASKANPAQRVVTASATFAKAADFDDPIDLEVEILRRGRTFSSVAVRSTQRGALVSPALMLMDTGAPDVIRHVTEMPDVPGPYDCPPFDMSVVGRDLRIVDGAYPPDPDEVGPPSIYAWMRFRENPAEPWLRSALIAQAAPHWTIAAAMRPHLGISQEQAHVTLSTGIMAIDIAFHDEAPLDEWFLYANPVIWAGRGLAHAQGAVFSHDGTLLATYSVHAMLRDLVVSPEAIAKGASTFM
jgi:uncharacterized protein (DUF427 family)/acyl-CoA thioesterase